MSSEADSLYTTAPTSWSAPSASVAIAPVRITTSRGEPGMIWVWITYPRECVEIQHARITSCTTSPLRLANRRESAQVAGGTRNAVPPRQRLLGACLPRAAERNVGFRDCRKGSARERGPLAGRLPVAHVPCGLRLDGRF